MFQAVSRYSSQGREKKKAAAVSIRHRVTSRARSSAGYNGSDVVTARACCELNKAQVHRSSDVLVKTIQRLDAFHSRHGMTVYKGIMSNSNLWLDLSLNLFRSQGGE